MWFRELLASLAILLVLAVTWPFLLVAAVAVWVLHKLSGVYVIQYPQQRWHRIATNDEDFEDDWWKRGDPPPWEQ